MLDSLSGAITMAACSRFGPDDKLYAFVGDLGRRGHLQNLRCGPTNAYDCPPAAPTQDDQFGGPAPDNAHLSGVVLRLNLDGSAPSDNPFFAAGAAIGGEAGANIQKVYPYGHRNSFGMAFDPNRRQPLAAGERRRQLLGAQSRHGRNERRLDPDRRTRRSPRAIQGDRDDVRRYEPAAAALAADQHCRQPAVALSRLFSLPNSHYEDPAFSWKWEVAPGGIGFVSGRALGPQYQGDLIVGAGTPLLEGGYLFRFNLTGNRRKVGVDDPRLEDRVADNIAKHEITESESLLFGRDFGVTTDVQTGPNGNLFVLSLTNGALYEIVRR